MKNRLAVLMLFSQFLFAYALYAQQEAKPSEKVTHPQITSYDNLVLQIQQLEASSGLLQSEVIGSSIQGRGIYAMKFSTSETGHDQSKIKVLIFAQQHGNEHSGKEASLLLASWLLKPENQYLLKKIDLVLIPQVNPDGADINKRRNANNVDLNRNHLTLTEPETQAVHRLFDKYMFEVTMDVHEYSPFGQEWRQYGYRKNSDITLGTCTSINISGKIRTLSNIGVLPFVLKHLSENNFTSFVYCPGGPPEKDYIRHSTFDINDGRQSFGIQNTFSFIQEGMNGSDMFAENITHRALGQQNAMIAMLKYVYRNKNKMKKIVSKERQELISAKPGQKISIQSEHATNGTRLHLPLFSYATQNDTIVVVDDYRPVVGSITDVSKPLGYLIPRQNTDLVKWVENHFLTINSWETKANLKLENYFIHAIDSINFEGDIIINPMVELKEMKTKINSADYLYLPLNQMKGNMIVLALEPKSMLGLVTYKQFESLLQKGKYFPVLRVVQNK